MGHDDDKLPRGVEFLDAASDVDDADEVLLVRPSRWPRWAPVLIAVIVAAVVFTLVLRFDGEQPATRSAHPSSTGPKVATAHGATPSETSPAETTPDTSLPPATIITVKAPLLGVTTGWELLGRSDQAVVRIDFARGRITRTAVPGLASSGPVFFVVGAHEAIVRPLDAVPGYRVPDGGPARQLPSTLTIGRGGPVFPGPRSDHVWVSSVDGGPADFGLAGLNDARQGRPLPVPTGAIAQNASPDGAGYLLFQTPGGVYDSRPMAFNRVTTGQVLAVGPTRWLVRECGGRTGGCKVVVIDQNGGRRRVLATQLHSAFILAGTISPDGSTAALIEGTGPPLIQLLNLSTGAVRMIPLRVDQSAADPGGLLTWSPDGRWLFAINENGRLYAVDARTDQITDLTAAVGPALADLSQIAIRDASAK